MSNYPLDPYGTLPSNLIQNEQHTVTATNSKDYHLIVPKLTPFFAKDISLEFLETGTNLPVPLVKDKDYYLSHLFKAGTEALGQLVYGSITLNNPNRTGIIILKQYRYIGGESPIDHATIIQRILQKTNNPRITFWEEIQDKPEFYPPKLHTHVIQDLTGFNEVVEALLSITQSIREKDKDCCFTPAEIRTGIIEEVLKLLKPETTAAVKEALTTIHLNPSDLTNELKLFIENTIRNLNQSNSPTDTSALELLIEKNKQKIAVLESILNTDVPNQKTAVETVLADHITRITNLEKRPTTSGSGVDISQLETLVDNAVKLNLQSFNTQIQSLINKNTDQDNKINGLKEDLEKKHRLMAAILNKLFFNKQPKPEDRVLVEDYINTHFSGELKLIKELIPVSKLSSNIIEVKDDGIYVSGDNCTKKP